MPVMDLIPANALISAVGWMLVHFLWQGCVIAVIYWLVCAFSRQNSAQLRYWSGMSGFLLSLVCLAVTFTVYFETAAQFPTQQQTESVNPFLVLAGTSPDAWSLLQDGIEPALPLVVLLWLLGVACCCTRTVLGWLGIRRLVGRADEDIGDELLQAVQRLKRTLQVRPVVRVLKSAAVHVPMAVGWLRPVILLPASVLVRLPAEQLEMIIAHELGHIRRGDYLWNLLQIVVETLLFYHPAIRWMSRRVRQERENCCDDLVVARCCKPATYARALANLEVMRSPVSAAVMTASGGNLLGRIKRIIDTELPRSSSGYAQVSLMAVVALMVALGAQQGLVLSRQLNQVAATALLQASDVEWKTWGQSRAAWGAGVAGFTQQPDDRLGAAWGHKSLPDTVPVIALETLPAVNPPVPAHHTAGPRGKLTAAEPRAKSTSAAQPVVATQWTHGPASPAVQADVTPRPFSTMASADMPAERIDSSVRQFAGAVTAHPGMPGPGHSRTESRLPGDENGPQELSPLTRVEPRYPWRARVEGTEGFVQVGFSVTAEGEVTNIDVVDSIPAGVFDRAAIKALKKWKFPAGTRSDEQNRWVQSFDFTLDDQARRVVDRRHCVVTGRRTCSRLPTGAVVVYVNPPTAATAVVEETRQVLK